MFLNPVYAIFTAVGIASVNLTLSVGHSSPTVLWKILFTVAIIATVAVSFIGDVVKTRRRIILALESSGRGLKNPRRSACGEHLGTVDRVMGLCTCSTKIWDCW